MSETRNSADHVDRSVVRDDAFTLDAILLQIGQFGKYQFINFLLLSIPMLANAIFSVTYVFTASTVVYRCNVTECDSTTSEYLEPWTNFTIPAISKDRNQCERYVTTTNSSYQEKLQNDFDQAKDGLICHEYNFNRNSVEECGSDLKFRDKEVSISNEFGIFCSDEWKLSLVGTVNNIGQFVGIPIGGYISDRFGRRTMLAAGGLASAIFGIVRSFSPSYLWFLLFEFLDSVAGSTLYATSFIICIELVGPKRRVLACSLIAIFYAIGEVILAIVAKYYQNWRILLRILYIPALVQILYFWILPESVRWLLSQGKEEKAARLLQKAAAINKRELSENTLNKLLLANRDKLKSTSENSFPIGEAFRTFFWRITNCSFCWFTNVLVYYGLSLNSVLLGGNKYNNFVYISLVEIPGLLLPYMLMDRIGRRYSLFSCMLITGICIASTAFIGSDQYIWQLALFLIGKLTISASFQVLYFFTAEIFPTTMRSSMLSFCSMIGRLGSILAPQTPLLGKYYENGPAILFSLFAILSGSTSLLFPETTNKVLPTTIKEADNIGGEDKKRNLKKQIVVETSYL